MIRDITEENERILEDAVNTGHFKDREAALSEALRLLQDRTSGEKGHVLSPDRWREKFEKHIASTPPAPATFVDDSRESIYEGRGE